VVVKFRTRLADPLVGVGDARDARGLRLLLPAHGRSGQPVTRVAGAIPTSGPGPNPLLQNHPLMAIHPPVLYVGYVGFTVPFAFAVAALVTGRLGEGWLAATRRWTLLAWGFLTVGIGLGSWWSYEVLGWGGFWAWDPVENASFLPWLTGTAYLHSVMVQERRGMLRVWNLSLLLSTFSLTILGTFLTRSGVLDSVHSFTESPIGMWLLAAFAATVLVTVGLIGWRGDRLRSPGQHRLAGVAGGRLPPQQPAVRRLRRSWCCSGTVFPLVVEAVNDERISVGTPYFNRMTAPIGLALLFLMAVAPALPWRKASGELLWERLRWPAWVGAGAVVLAVAVGRPRHLPLVAFGLGGFAAAAAVRQLVLAVAAARRAGASPLRAFVGRSNGGMIVHIGVVVVAVAFTAASSYTTSATYTLVEGASATIAGHTVTYEGMNPEEVDAQKTKLSARIRVDGGQVYEPALNQFPNATQTIGTPSVRVGAVDDVYLTLVAAPERAGGRSCWASSSSRSASWLWVGGGIMGFGTLLAAWPSPRRRADDPAEPAGAVVATGDGGGPAHGAGDGRGPAVERVPTGVG
jgi:cytochrome c-type biogenesis protein CcmF